MFCTEKGLEDGGHDLIMLVTSYVGVAVADCDGACGTGTHDNETTVGWWNDSAQDAEKEYIKRYLHTNGKDIAGDFMRESFKSVSKTSIVMLQVTCPAAVSHTESIAST